MALWRGHVGHVWLVWLVGYICAPQEYGVNIGVNSMGSPPTHENHHYTHASSTPGHRALVLCANIVHSFIHRVVLIMFWTELL